jgi:multicomponent Na+:H+ antiporter subunit E
MNFFALHLILGIVWLFLTGSFTTANLIFGLIVGYGVIAVAQPYLGSGNYVRSVIATFRFARKYLMEIVLANVQLARDLLKPDMPFVPGIIRYQTHGLTTAEVTVLANMISLTPGTLSMDTDETGTVLYIHSVYASDRGDLQASFDKLADLIKSVKHPEGKP